MNFSNIAEPSGDSTVALVLQVRGCAFHFAKALNTKRDELGLRSICTHINVVARWFQRVRHLPFLPDDFREDFSRDLLAARPLVSPLDAARLEQFAKYFEGFWLTNEVVKDIWGQFENDEPRTTNMVEGWHNGLHSRLTSQHPDLGEFIQFLQLAQYSAQNRIQALLHDPLAVAYPTAAHVSHRNVRDEMAAFAACLVTSAPCVQEACNYIDRVVVVFEHPS